jgi:hypothetical protein
MRLTNSMFASSEVLWVLVLAILDRSVSWGPSAAIELITDDENLGLGSSYELMVPRLWVVRSSKIGPGLTRVTTLKDFSCSGLLLLDSVLSEFSSLISSVMEDSTM